MKKIGVIGAGTMGNGIAQVLAQGGFNVVLRDLKHASLEIAMTQIDKNFNRMIEKGKLSETEKQQALNNIYTTIEILDLKDCDMIIEAATESIEVKKRIFQELDKICDEKTILATNTSSLSITELASATQHPQRVIGMHFFNPVPVMKLVEIIKGMITDEEVVNSVIELSKALGKTPVRVEEAPGFVVNRILIPMINEAVGVFADGVASPNEIDEAMKLGANHPIGPLALADLIGLDVCLAIMEVLYNEFADSKYRPHPMLKKYVRAGHLGRKTNKGFFNY
ncbi:3-hydroxybutyryl-CoA dehydrogenase [Alkaliphilus peptidifermentans]|uniref:3-hydroxybutyryl-CoA dehydrogenase n=1 Tax=Alkaliphilus peptidifermentans DSM 18978 TaxID=1120976 RepID=A0A1G5BI94_9FIRM|nr:3-hydroxybutyryl-CoA dehydrogenase [Alkaliphilus peptidifermentans]SCX89836.1 3-hydroxyacyl-CoA dehydrogenase [Alkaliphilus peptidifermentans DSM 18978]